MKRYLHASVLCLVMGACGCAAEKASIDSQPIPEGASPSKLAENFQLPRLEERQLSTSSTRDRSRDDAIVRSGKWQEAGEHFAARPRKLLQIVVSSAYQANRTRTKDAVERDRYAFELLHFVFWHVNPLPSSMSGSTPWAEYARHYEALAKTMKLPSEQESLDMSHVDLLEEA
jgi:hypothetical protein